MGLISSGLIAMVQMLSAAKERGFFCTEILKPSYANPCPNTSVLANCHLSCCCRLTGLLLSRETDGKGSEKRWPGENRCLLPSTALWMTPLMSSIVSLKNQHQTTHDIYIARLLRLTSEHSGQLEKKIRIWILNHKAHSFAGWVTQ